MSYQLTSKGKLLTNVMIKFCLLSKFHRTISKVTCRHILLKYRRFNVGQYCKIKNKYTNPQEPFRSFKMVPNFNAVHLTSSVVRLVRVGNFMVDGIYLELNGQRKFISVTWGGSTLMV